MHDLFEGVCRYIIPKVLNILANVEGLFTIETLNQRIRFFDHGSVQTSRDIPPFTQEHLKKGMFICSASEMKLLMEKLGLMIGDLVSENNVTWGLYLDLRELHCLLLKTMITIDIANSMRALIAKLNRDYQEILGERLIYKLHFLTHYPRIVLKNGPMYNLSCMRLEAKHKVAKEYARVCRSRTNICFSLLTKNQLSFAERLQTKKGFQDRVKLGRCVQIESHQLHNYNQFNVFISHDLLSKYQFVTSSVEINGTVYKTGMILVIGEVNNLMQFGEIKHVLVSEGLDVAFILLNLHTNKFIRHSHAFSVDYSSDWSIVTHQNLYHYKPRNIHSLITGNKCVPC